MNREFNLNKYFSWVFGMYDLHCMRWMDNFIITKIFKEILKNVLNIF